MGGAVVVGVGGVFVLAVVKREGEERRGAPVMGEMKGKREKREGVGSVCF